MLLFEYMYLATTMVATCILVLSRYIVLYPSDLSAPLRNNPRAKEEGLKGFHERMPARLDQQYLANRILEVEEGLRKGEYKLPFSQDPKKLVAAGHFGKVVL